jgi:signal transduction histidine kinase
LSPETASPLKQLSDLSARLWKARDLEEGLQEMLVATTRLLGTSMGNVQLLERDRCVLTLAAHRGFKEDFVDLFREVTIEHNTACSRALERKERVVIDDVLVDPAFIPYWEVLTKAGFRTVQSTPLLSHSGEVLGVISTHFPEPRRFEEEELHSLDLYARQASHFIERCQLDRQLRRSEKRFRALVKASSYATYRMSADWLEMRELNGAGLLFDLKSPSRSWPETYIEPEDRPLVKNAIRLAIESKRMFDLEHRVRFADGSIGWAHSRAVPIQNADGEIVEWFGAATDITAKKTAEMLIQHEGRRKDEFIAMLAHELRNPLAALYSAFLALKQLAEKPETRNVHGIIERQMAQLTRLVDDLLDVSRIASGKLELKRSPVDLADIVRQAIETTEPIISKGRHELETSLSEVPLSEVPLTVDGDAVRLTQAIVNLLSNAAKYTPDGGRIAIATTREAAVAILSVRDNGIGVSSEMLSQVFGIFAQSDLVVGREQGGLGVGLAVARKLVEMHGGTIAGYSEGVNRGSEFVIRLPLISADAHCEKI